MADDSATALRDLRDALRNPIADTDTFTFLLSSTLSALGLHTSSKAVAIVENDQGTSPKALERYLPIIQHLLITQVLPTFLPVLEHKDRQLAESFFCPPRSTSAPGALRTCRTIASITYPNISQYFSNPSTTSGPGTTPPLAFTSRDFLLEITSKLVDNYGIDDLYWAVWSGGKEAEGSKEDGQRTLRWEETVRAAVALPAKVANAVGRWKSQASSGNIPRCLLLKNPETFRPYYDKLIVRLEGLLYELAVSVPPPGPDRLQLVFQRLAAVGLVQPASGRAGASGASLFPALLPPLLQHLHPIASPLPAYPAGFLPRIFLSLSTSLLNTFTDALLSHLTHHLIPPSSPLMEHGSDGRIFTATTTLTRIIGPPVLGGEAWDAVVRSALSRSSVRPFDGRQSAKVRVITAWISQSGEKGIKSFINTILASWADPKNIKFTLYSPQFHLTHLLIAALSLLPRYHAFLGDIAFQPRFLIACQSYLAHPDGSIRRLGMLVAEIVSELSIREEEGEGLEYDEAKETEDLMNGLDLSHDDEEKNNGPVKKNARKGLTRLHFGAKLWEGDGDGREEARWLRKKVGVLDRSTLVGGGPEQDWMLGWSHSPPESDSDSVSRIAPVEILNHPEASNGPSRGREQGASRTAPAVPKPSRKPPKIVMLDETQSSDPLQGYASASPSSSRSPSPTPSYYDDIAADPSLALDASQKKKITRPVYIGQLLQLLTEKDNADAIEVALKYGESLIRAKRGFGRELAENAVNLVGYLVGMNDQYGLEGFEEKRQGMVTAVAACAPREVAPFLAIQYFINQYSLQQKSIMLTAMAMAARELAGIQVPSMTPQARKIDFPSKTLPPALHRRYASPVDTPLGLNAPAGQIDVAAESLRGLLLSKGAKKAEQILPEVAREKRLRVGTTMRQNGIVEVGTLRERQLAQATQAAVTKANEPVVPFREVAAECFIMPLINGFWQHFQDSQIRETRAILTGSRYRGAGAGLVLSPLALEKFLMTLSLLIHAARFSPVFLAVLAPESLELAITIGNQHPNQPNDYYLDEQNVQHDGSKTEAQVLGAALELALVTLDTSVDLDQGRTFAMDKPQLILAAAEWAHGVFETENRGGKVASGQGSSEREGRVRTSAAGVIVKTGEIGEKWAYVLGRR